MGEIPEEPRGTEEKGLSKPSVLLLAGVLTGSPAGFALALVLAFEDFGAYVFLFVPIALQMMYLTSIYLLGSAPPRPDRDPPRTIRLAVFVAYLVIIVLIAWWVCQDAFDPTLDTDEVIGDIATGTFLYVHPIHGVLVLLLTGFSSTFRAKGRSFRTDLILAILAFLMPYLNFLMFFALA